MVSRVYGRVIRNVRIRRAYLRLAEFGDSSRSERLSLVAKEFGLRKSTILSIVLYRGAYGVYSDEGAYRLRKSSKMSRTQLLGKKKKKIVQKKN